MNLQGSDEATSNLEDQMTALASAVVRPQDVDGHVEAYCSTGSSPGTVPARLDLEHRGPTEVGVRYEVHGPASAPVVVALGGISAHSHLSPTSADPSHGWWPGVVGPGAALDTNRFRVVGIDYLGGPATPLEGAAPVTSADQAKAVLAVFDHLEIDRATLLGASYGGMVALSLALDEPCRVRDLVLLCAAHRTHPMATAVRALQRNVIRFALECGREEEGLTLARALAMTTYRSSQEFEARFGRTWTSDEDGRPRFEVEEYLEARGSAFVGRFPPSSFIRLSESIDLHDVNPARLSVPTTLVSWDSDVLVPPWLVEELKQSVACACTHIRLSSPFGHDAFLKEDRDVSSVLLNVIGEGVVR